jgi:hypothetical protein
MSALGQKRTCAPQKAMSALPPIATSIAFFGMSALGQKQTFGKNCMPSFVLARKRHSSPEVAPQLINSLT